RACGGVLSSGTWSIQVDHRPGEPFSPSPRLPAPRAVVAVTRRELLPSPASARPFRPAARRPVAGTPPSSGVTAGAGGARPARTKEDSGASRPADTRATGWSLTPPARLLIA